MMLLPHWNCGLGSGLVAISLGLGLGAGHASATWAATASFTVRVQLNPAGCTATGGTSTGQAASLSCDGALSAPIMATASASPTVGAFGVSGAAGIAPVAPSSVQIISTGASVAPAALSVDTGRLAVQSYSEARLAAGPSGTGLGANLPIGQTLLNSASIPMSAQMHQSPPEDTGAGSSPRREVVFVF
jgi:hypothetical protein